MTTRSRTREQKSRRLKTDTKTHSWTGRQHVAAFEIMNDLCATQSENLAVATVVDAIVCQRRHPPATPDRKVNFDMLLNMTLVVTVDLRRHTLLLRAAAAIANDTEPRR